MNEAIRGYNDSQPETDRAICDVLATEIDGGLPGDAEAVRRVSIQLGYSYDQLWKATVVE